MPATLAARLCRVPVVVVSYDRRPGLASQADAHGSPRSCAAAFAGSPLPRARRHRRAGPRRDHRRRPRPRPRRGTRASSACPPDRFVVAVFGGSLGAKALNEAVARPGRAAAPTAATSRVYHVVGDRWLADAPPARDGDDGILYRVIGYEDRMPQLYAAADLMVTRAGASTIAELAATGHAGDRRAVARCGREPPARQRATAGRRRRGGPARAARPVGATGWSPRSTAASTDPAALDRIAAQRTRRTARAHRGDSLIDADRARSRAR